MPPDLHMTLQCLGCRARLLQVAVQWHCCSSCPSFNHTAILLVRRAGILSIHSFIHYAFSPTVRYVQSCASSLSAECSPRVAWSIHLLYNLCSLLDWQTVALTYSQKFIPRICCATFGLLLHAGHTCHQWHSHN